MRQKQLYGIGIYEDEILLTDYTGPAEKTFLVAQSEVMRLFHHEQSVRFKPFPGLIWMNAYPNQRADYLVTFKRRRWTILYQGKTLTSHQLELPNMAIVASIRDQSVHIDRCFGFRKELNKASDLYDLPLPNLRDGQLCNSGSTIPAGKDVMRSIEAALFDSPFNHHRYLVGRENIKFLDYLKKYKGKSPFHSLPIVGKGASILED
jgi:hypothetical protein